MIRNYKKFSKFVEDVMDRVPAVRTVAIRRAMLNYFGKEIGENTGLTASVLYAMQKEGLVLLSEDGWCITKDEYETYSDDYQGRLLDYESKFRLGKITDKVYNQKNYRKNALIKAFPVIVEMMPASYDFMIADRPFHYVFHGNTNGKEKRLYEIIYIAEDDEDFLFAELRDFCPKLKDDLIRDKISRVAIFEKPLETHYKYLPKVGFTSVVEVFDEDVNEKEIHQDKVDIPLINVVHVVNKNERWAEIDD